LLNQHNQQGNNTMPKTKEELAIAEDIQIVAPKIELPKDEKIAPHDVKPYQSIAIAESKFEKPAIKVQEYAAPKLERSKEHQAHDKARVTAIDKLRKFVVKSVGLTEEEFNTLF
jgi:hypothetical protein